MTNEEKSVLINLDRFQIISGQKNSLSQHKKTMNQEIDRLEIIYKKNYFKKREWKQKFKEKDVEMKRAVMRLENEIQKYQERVIIH